MEPWYKVVLPRKELREGRSLDPSEFAVHLEQIVAGNAPEDYQHPAKFCARTFFGQALTDYCRLVLRRLAGETAGTAPVLSLLTQFGGGKTHTLATLYHLVVSGARAREFEGVSKLLQDIGLAEIPQARVGVFVGTSWHSIPGRETPWLDLAVQLADEAGRQILGEEARHRAPSSQQIQQIFRLAGQPVLLLFDEVLNYIQRFPEQAGQFYAFVQNLTAALTSSERAVGLLSLPISTTVEMTPEMMAWQTRLTKLIGREGKPLLATEAGEIAEIIRRRLFEDIGRKSLRQAVARQYARWVFSRRDRLPSEFANFPEEDLKKRFEVCYPFHPSTLTVFQRKWQTLPTFQQTRGTLAMLGLWISHTFRTGYQGAFREPLITLGSAPMDEREFRSKILEQLNEGRLEAAIVYDIAGENAHARALDKELATGAGKNRLHQRVATALFFESCGGMVTDKAATLADLRFALGDPDTETTAIDQAVHALYDRCYYLRRVGESGWRFGYKPNLRKLHADRKAGINPEQVEKQMRAVVQQLFRTKPEINLTFFPKASAEIADRPQLVLVVLDPDRELDEALITQLTEWTRNCGQTPRQYPGGVFWLAPASSSGLKEAVKEWLAWESLKKDAERGLLGDLEREDERMLPEEFQKAEDLVEDQVWSMYQHLILWDGKQGVLRSIDLPHLHKSEARSLTGAVLARLRHAGELNQEVGASYVERNWPESFKERGAWPLASLLAAFFQGRLTRLEKAEQGLKQMIVRAVRQGVFGLGSGQDEAKMQRVWFKEDVDPSEIMFDYETYLLLPARAEAEKAGKPSDFTYPEGPPPPGPLPPPPPDAGPQPPPIPPEKEYVFLAWRGTLPKEKWNLFSHRVLARLSGAEDLKIEVTIQAKVKDLSAKPRLDLALRDLELEGQFKEKSGESNGEDI